MAQERHKTKYAGVFFILNEHEERVYYIRYRQAGAGRKVIEEKIGKASHGMTPAKANHIRAERMANKELSNTERRIKIKEEKQATENHYTINRIWELYRLENESKPIMKADKYLIKHLQPFSEMTPSELTNKALSEFQVSLTKIVSQRGTLLSPQSQKHILALLRRLLAFASDKELCEVPVLKFKMPKVDNQKTEYMTQEQERKYLEILENDPNQKTANILKFIFHTGIRKGATLALKWSDVDLEKGLVTLQGDSAKSDKTEILPLSDKALAILQSVERTQSPYVFPNENGEKRQDIRKFANKIKAQAGLDTDFRAVHGLRHNFASSLVNNGADLYSVQKLLTHSSPEMTQRYAHLQMETLKNLLNK